MKKSTFIKLLLCCVVAVLALCLLASCGEETGGQKASDYSAEHLDDLPDDLDFKGEKVTVLYWGYDFIEWELTSDGSSGDIVEKAVNKRNTAVESRLGVKLNYIKGEAPAEVFSPTVRDEVMSGSKDYDLIVAPQTTGVHNAKDGVYRDVKDFKYLDLSKPYWNDEYNQALSVNEKRFMIGGDISLTTIGWGSTMFIEKEPFEQLFGDMEEFYEFVYSGEWTLDEYAERCKQCYRDLNGNGLKDPEDQFGTAIGTRGHSVTDVYCFSSGVTYSKRDENGTPYVDMKNDRTMEFVEKFSSLVYNNAGVLPITPEISEYSGDISSVFSAGAMHNAVERRGDDDDFGIVPLPKLDMKETKYHAWLSDNTASFSVPITEDDDKLDMVGAVLEALASETSRLCFPEYFERALKSKYIRDSWSAKMLDLIHEGLTTDFISCYGDCLEGMGNFMRLVMSGSEPNFVSNYDAKEPALLQKLKELFEAFEQNTSGNFVPVTEHELSSEEIEELDDFAVNEISSSWVALGTKYKKSGIWVKPDISDKFRYKINANNEIEVRSPDMQAVGGYYPSAAIVSRETLPIKDLKVTFHIDEGFDYTNTGWSSSFSVLWTDKPVKAFDKYLETVGTNGLRQLVSDDTIGLCISFMGADKAGGTISDWLYIILYDGKGTRPEADNRIGYRFSNQVGSDLGQTTSIEIKEDDELGYVVLVNDTEIRTGVRNEETYPIDLSILKDVEEGYLTVGGEANLEFACNWTLCTINDQPAGTYFD